MVAKLAKWIDADPDVLGIERMEPRADKPSAWHALIDLALISGGVFDQFPLSGHVDVYPSVWTRKRRKPANHVIIRKQLDAAELKLATAAANATTKEHAKEVWDAVGIGLYMLGRLP